MIGKSTWILQPISLNDIGTFGEFSDSLLIIRFNTSMNFDVNFIIIQFCSKLQ